MNLVHAGLASLLLLGAYAAFPGPTLDRTPVGAIPAQPRGEALPRFELTSSLHDTSCFIAVGAPAGEGRRRLHPEPACAKLGLEAGEAAYWLERQDGTAALLDEEGSTAFEFAVGDGAAFESYRPAQPVMTLISAD